MKHRVVYEVAKGLPVSEGLAPAARWDLLAAATLPIRVACPREHVLFCGAKLVDLIPLDERPRQAKDELRVALNEILAPDVYEIDCAIGEFAQKGTLVLKHPKPG